jgi:hypothetical protein
MPLNSSFKDSLDIANRACDACGVPHILDVNSTTDRQLKIIGPLYDKMRQFELSRNIWRFAKRRVTLRAIDATTQRIAPQLYDASALYLPGSIVTDANGDVWMSFAAENVGNAPGVNDVWEPYYGPVSASLWVATTTYDAGELVYKPVTGVAGSFIVYMSLIDANKDVPDTATAWDTTVTYGLDAVVSSSSFQWRSVIPYNVGNTPALAPSDWVVGTTYALNDTATGSDGFIYTSTGNGNVGHDPVTDAGVHWTRGAPYAWERVPTIQPASTNWLPIYTTVRPLGVEWLLTVPQDGRSIYLLPNGYLREARIEPKNKGLPSDRNVYGEYIQTSENPLTLAYVADVTKVGRMHPMFCEMLALRIAEEAVEPLTQSEQKLASIISKYTKFGFEARQVNAIEEGYVEPDEDDYITVRW